MAPLLPSAAVRARRPPQQASPSWLPAACLVLGVLIGALGVRTFDAAGPSPAAAAAAAARGAAGGRAVKLGGGASAAAAALQASSLRSPGGGGGALPASAGSPLPSTLPAAAAAAGGAAGAIAAPPKVAGSPAVGATAAASPSPAVAAPPSPSPAASPAVSPAAAPAAAAPGQPQQRRAYVFYAAQNDYMCSALVNVHRLQLVGASPLSEAVIIIPPGFEPLPAHKASAERLGVRLVRAPQLRGPTLTGYYADCMAKLYSFNLTEYARVVFLDADSVVLRPLDALFDLPDAAPLAAPRAYWLNPGKLKPNCGGVGWKASDGPQVGMQMKFTSAVMSLAPSAALWDRLSSKYFPNGTPKLDPGVFDMDLLNIEFKDEASLLRGEAVLALTGHWAEAARDSVPSAFQGKLTQDELWRLTRVVHFSPLKPWSGANGAARRANSNAHPHYYEAFQLWEASQKLVCG